jgi:hypothetical protein
MKTINKAVMVVSVLLLLAQSGAAYVIPAELVNSDIKDEYALVSATLILHDQGVRSQEINDILVGAAGQNTNSGRLWNNCHDLRVWLEKVRVQRMNQQAIK